MVCWRSVANLSMDTASHDIKPSTDPTIDRPADTEPVAGIALSAPDDGQDYPAFAATVGQENRIKVWELYRILDVEEGLRSRRAIRYPVRQRN